MKRRTSAYWLRYYGLDTTSEAATIVPESAPVRIEQVFEYDPPKVLVEDSVVRFCSVCDIVSSRVRFIAEISGGPAWSTDPDWLLSTRLSIAGDFAGRITRSFDSAFRTNERVKIAGNYRPIRLILVGTAHRPLNFVRPDNLQEFVLSFSFTDGEFTEVKFEFTDHRVFVPKYKDSEGACRADNADQPLPEVDLHEE